MIGDEIASRIVFVCSDTWKPYLTVIRGKCSEALHILDRFHIAANMSKALDEVRARESRLVLKRGDNLKTEQRFRLRKLLRYNLKTVRAYLLKEAFQQLWDYNSATWADKFLDEWCRQVMRSRIEPMKTIARSLREHRELILNYFPRPETAFQWHRRGPEQQSQSHLEKILRLSHFQCLELALYHSLGKLPEPEATHDFF